MLNQLTSFLGQNTTPGAAGNVVWATIYILLIFAGVSLCVIIMNWGERKAMAHMQVRLGPMRVGPHGLLQPIADAIKLLLKEDTIPGKADQAAFWCAPLFVVVASFTVFLVVPFGPAQAVTDMNIGLLFMLGVSSLGVLGIVTAGWASNSHYPLMGSLRSGAQMVSYEVAMGMAVISAIVMTSLTGAGMYGVGSAAASGTLSMIGIVRAQEAQHVWFAFKLFPLGFIAFFTYAVAMVAETNRAPFDLPEAESELVAGFHTEYSGFRWSLFFLGEYAAMIAVSSIAVTLWFGGWLRPFPNALSGPLWNGAFSLMPSAFFLFLAALTIYYTVKMPMLLRVQAVGLGVFGLLLAGIAVALLVPAVRTRVEPVFWFMLKIAMFMYVYIWFRATFPRYRFDQLMRVGWKVLLPIAIGVLLLTGIAGLTPEIARWIRS